MLRPVIGKLPHAMDNQRLTIADACFRKCLQHFLAQARAEVVVIGTESEVLLALLYAEDPVNRTHARAVWQDNYWLAIRQSLRRTPRTSTLLHRCSAVFTRRSIGPVAKEFDIRWIRRCSEISPHFTGARTRIGGCARGG